MKKPLPHILIKCNKQIQNYIQDYLINYEEAKVLYVDSAEEIEKLAPTIEPALLITNINSNNRLPSTIIEIYRKRTKRPDSPILLISEYTSQVLKFKPTQNLGYYDILPVPFSKEIFINKLSLLLHLHSLQSKANDTYQKTSSKSALKSKKDLLKSTEKLSNEVVHHLRTKLALQDKVQQIDESSQFLEMLIESIPIPLFIKNNKGEFVKCNKAFENFIETPRENFFGKTITDIALTEFSDKVHRSDMKIIQSEKSKISEEVYRKLDGSLVNTIVHLNVFLNKVNHTKGLIGIIVDITRIKRTEKLLKIQSTIDYLASLKGGTILALKNIFKNIMDLEWIDGGGIYLYNKEKEELRLIHSAGLSKEFVESAKIYKIDSPQLNIVLGQKPVYGNYQEIVKRIKNQPKEESLKFVAAIPLINPESGDPIGCLNLTSRLYNNITNQEKSELETISQRLVSLILYAQSQDKVNELTSQLESKVKERTKELRKSEQKFRNLQDNVPIGIFTTKPTGEIIYVNRAIVSMFKYKNAREMRSLKAQEYYVNKNDRDKIMQKLKKEGFVNNFEFQVKKADGEEFWTATSMRPIYDTEGKLFQFDGIIEDITARKSSENKLKQANREIQSINKNLEKRVAKAVNEQKHNQQYLLQKSKLESLGELSAGIAHEINQPLGVLVLSLENLHAKIGTKLATPDYLENKFHSIEGNIAKIRQIIDHIRTFSRDHDFIAMEKVNLNKVVNKALSLIGTQYQNHNIKIQLDLKEEIGFTIGSNIQVEQVILNLLSNAKYAVEERATYMDETEYTKEIIVRTKASEKKVSLEIEDNGTGIKVTELPKIYDPFFTTKPEGFGTGVGLSIAYGIVKSMRGDIEVRTKKDKYTKFKILFPRFPENN